MAKIRLDILTLVVMFSLPLPSHAQSKVGTAGANFLAVPLNPVAAGLGGAYVAVASDPLSSFWNVAGVANVKSELSAGFSYVNYVAGTKLGAVSMVKKLGLRGNLVVFVGGFNSGSMTHYEIGQDGIHELGTFSYSDAQLGIGFARYYTDKFASGFAVKFLHEGVSGITSSNGFAIDVGTYFWTGFKTLRIAMSMQNIGPDMKFSGTYQQYIYKGNEVVTEDRNYTAYPIPMNFRLGAAMEVIKDSRKRLTLSVESDHPSDFNQTLAIGAEFAYSNMIFIRSGYNFGLDLGGFGFGFGIKKGGFSLDYSFSDMGEWPDIHRLSITFSK